MITWEGSYTPPPSFPPIILNKSILHEIFSGPEAKFPLFVGNTMKGGFWLMIISGVRKPQTHSVSVGEGIRRINIKWNCLKPTPSYPWVGFGWRISYRMVDYFIKASRWNTREMKADVMWWLGIMQDDGRKIRKKKFSGYALLFDSLYLFRWWN